MTLEQGTQAARMSSPGPDKDGTLLLATTPSTSTRKKRGAKSGAKGARGNYQHRVQDQMALAIQQKEEEALLVLGEDTSEEDDAGQLSDSSEDSGVSIADDYGDGDNPKGIQGTSTAMATATATAENPHMMTGGLVGFNVFSEAAHTAADRAAQARLLAQQRAAATAEQAAARAAATAMVARQSAANMFHNATTTFTNTATSTFANFGFGHRHQAFDDDHDDEDVDDHHHHDDAHILSAKDGDSHQEDFINTNNNQDEAQMEEWKPFG